MTAESGDRQSKERTDEFPDRVRAAKEASVKYALQRRTFGKMIAEHQLIQEKIARMAQDHEIAQMLYLKVGWLKNKGERCTLETSYAKKFASEASFNAANEAIQIHGAYGFSDEYDVERMLRNSKGAVIYEGTREIHKLRIAVERQGMTMVPLEIYFNERGRAKLEIGIAKGKKAPDKRATEAKRDWQRDKARLLRERG